MADKPLKNSDLGNFLVSAPLYQPVAIDSADILDTAEASLSPAPRKPTLKWLVPDTLKKSCNECEGAVTWERLSGAYVTAGLQALVYRCRSCERSWFGAWLHVQFLDDGTKLRLEKVGQMPRLEVTLSKEFEKALGPRADLYRKGMTARHNGYGIGALPYFRRLIESTTDEMLSLLEHALKQEGSSANPALAELARIKTGTRFEDKVKLAAKVLPPHLRPEGVNPFEDLYQLLSDGLHAQTDSECIDIVDGLDVALKHIYTRLKSYAESEKLYVTAAKELRAKVVKRKRERGKSG